jgi:uroporphyrin-III C-methyltransferase
VSCATVHLVGAGPGAADLLTVRAARLIGAADVVLHDALVEPEVLALCRPEARIVNVGKRAGRSSVSQDVICRLLVRAARADRLVVRLKGGDPMLFGRAGEEIDALRRAGVQVEIVPGISSGFAAAAAVQASLTLRGIARSATFVTPAQASGGEQDGAWAAAAAAADTAVLYMGRSQASRIRDELLAHGVPSQRPVLLVESASRADERILGGTLGGLPALAEHVGDGPVLLLVGDAFARAAAAHWHVADLALDTPAAVPAR